MIITLDMSSFEVDQSDRETEYDEEINQSGWNPAVDMMVLEQLEHVTPDDNEADSFAVIQQNSHADVADIISNIIRRKTYSYRH